MVNAQYNAALIAVEMSLRYRGTAWVRGPESDAAIVLCGVDEGRPFAVAVHGLLGRPSPDQMALLARWRKAGAATGLAHTVAEALSIAAGVGSRAR